MLVIDVIYNFWWLASFHFLISQAWRVNFLASNSVLLIGPSVCDVDFWRSYFGAVLGSILSFLYHFLLAKLGGLCLVVSFSVEEEDVWWLEDVSGSVVLFLLVCCWSPSGDSSFLVLVPESGSGG